MLRLRYNMVGIKDYDRKKKGTVLKPSETEWTSVT